MDSNKEKNSQDIEIVIGDNTTLNISDVGDCMNDLRPKDTEKKKKNLVIPHINLKKKKNK